MRIDVIGRGVEVTEAMRTYAESKAAKLPKYYDGLQAITVSISPTSHIHTPEYDAELVLDVEKHEDFVSHAKGKDPYAAIDMVMEKGERQLRDFKERMKNSKH
jgi:putative sigma-54 modulation protein